jgi:hypothetical protein
VLTADLLFTGQTSPGHMSLFTPMRRGPQIMASWKA